MIVCHIAKGPIGNQRFQFQRFLSHILYAGRQQEYLAICIQSEALTWRASRLAQMVSIICECEAVLLSWSHRSMSAPIARIGAAASTLSATLASARIPAAASKTTGALMLESSVCR